MKKLDLSAAEFWVVVPSDLLFLCISKLSLKKLMAGFAPFFSLMHKIVLPAKVGI